MITKEQLKYIHTIKSRYNVSEKDYRKILNNRFGMSSSKELSKHQATDLIKILQQLFVKSTKDDDATDKQLGRLKHQYKSLYPKKNINEYIERVFWKGKNISNITKKEASKLIYMLEEVEAWKLKKKRL